MYYTYILQSRLKKRTYTGVTDNPDKRLREHNSGKVISSRKYRPYEILHIDEFDNKRQARAKEAFYKTTTGRRRIKEILDKGGLS